VRLDARREVWESDGGGVLSKEDPDTLEGGSVVDFALSKEDPDALKGSGTLLHDGSPDVLSGCTMVPGRSGEGSCCRCSMKET